jgi:hypothetical protein
LTPPTDYSRALAELEAARPAGPLLPDKKERLVRSLGALAAGASAGLAESAFFGPASVIGRAGAAGSREYGQLAGEEREARRESDRATEAWQTRKAGVAADIARSDSEAQRANAALENAADLARAQQAFQISGLRQPRVQVTDDGISISQIMEDGSIKTTQTPNPFAIMKTMAYMSGLRGGSSGESAAALRDRYERPMGMDKVNLQHFGDLAPVADLAWGLIFGPVDPAARQQFMNNAAEQLKGDEMYGVSMTLAKPEEIEKAVGTRAFADAMNFLMANPDKAREYYEMMHGSQLQ